MQLGLHLNSRVENILHALTDSQEIRIIRETIVQAKENSSLVSFDCTAIVAKIVVEIAPGEKTHSPCVQILQQEGAAHCVSNGLVQEHLQHGLSALLQ